MATNTVNLYFDVARQMITRTDEEKVASGAVNTIVANFKFCNTWKNYYKYCRFEGAGGVKDVRLVDDSCVVPWEMLEAPGFKMACFGTISSDTMLTTEKIYVKVYQSINFIADDALPADETPSLLLQYESIIDKAAADQEANNAAQAENNARTDAMVTEVEELVMNNIQPTIAGAESATAEANAAAERANNAVIDMEQGNVPIMSISEIDSYFNN